MGQRFYNSLTRRLEDFAPQHPPRVTLYACGPTVYGHVHIGNWTSFVFYDVLVRWLRESGFEVTYVENVTDVDDRIIQTIGKSGESRAAFTKRWEDAFLQGMDSLGCVRADHHPRAADHVPGMAAMIQTLLDKGHAYQGADGSIYFRIASFPTYGELANLDKSALRAGASGRVQSEDFEKAEVADFALWKAFTPEDGDVVWEPEFTIGGSRQVVRGRPGWHIECSVMASALLGDRIDVHIGGEDLLFPHHQNEIAQSEAATGKRPFVRTWLHRRFLLVDGAKMSRSKKNFYTLTDVVDREGPFAARGFRYLIATAHYRKPIDFTWTGLKAAMKTLRNLDDAFERLRGAAGAAAPSHFADGAASAFRAAMEDDLETSSAAAAVHGLVHEANRRATSGTLTAADAASALAVFRMAGRVLGLGLGDTRSKEPSAEQHRLLSDRERARSEKRFSDADRLRKDLLALGIEVKDTKSGQEWSFL